jgi:hypothetical protein
MRWRTSYRYGSERIDAIFGHPRARSTARYFLFAAGIGALSFRAKTRRRKEDVVLIFLRLCVFAQKIVMATKRSGLELGNGPSKRIQPRI